MTRQILETLPFIARMPRWLRDYLDSWKFWRTIFLIGIAAAVVLGYYNYQRTLHDETGRETTAYVSCVTSIPLLKDLSAFVGGVNEWLGPRGVLVRNAEAQVNATPPGDPLYLSRKQALRRDRSAAKEVGHATGLPVPTPEQCLEQSKHVPNLQKTNSTNTTRQP